MLGGGGVGKRRRCPLWQCATPDQQEHLIASRVSCPRSHGKSVAEWKADPLSCNSRKIAVPPKSQDLAAAQVGLDGIKERDGSSWM